MTTKKNKIQAAILVAVLTAIGGGFYAYKEYNRKGYDLANSKPLFSLEATEIIKQFNNNEQSSNQQYLSKIIEIRGQIKKIDTDSKGSNTIVLGDSSSMSSVRCSLDSLYNGSAAALSVGQTVAIKGLCTGFIADDMGIGADVILTHCITQKK